MPDAKPMSEGRLVWFEGFSDTGSPRPRNAYDNLIAELAREVRRLKRREEELKGHLRWALRHIGGPGHWKDATGKLHCPLCGISLGGEHDGTCSYRQAKEALEK